MFELVIMFELALTTESKWTTDMQIDLNMLVPSSRTGLKVNSGIITLGDRDLKRQ
jgi:hypothetical protein